MLNCFRSSGSSPRTAGSFESSNIFLGGTPPIYVEQGAFDQQTSTVKPDLRRSSQTAIHCVPESGRNGLKYQGHAPRKTNIIRMPSISELDALLKSKATFSRLYPELEGTLWIAVIF